MCDIWALMPGKRRVTKGQEDNDQEKDRSPRETRHVICTSKRATRQADTQANASTCKYLMAYAGRHTHTHTTTQLTVKHTDLHRVWQRQKVTCQWPPRPYLHRLRQSWQPFYNNCILLAFGFSEHPVSVNFWWLIGPSCLLISHLGPGLVSMSAPWCLNMNRPLRPSFCSIKLRMFPWQACGCMLLISVFDWKISMVV